MDNFVRVSTTSSSGDANSSAPREVFRRKRPFVPYLRRTLCVLLASLQGSAVVIELKNDTEVWGVVESVDSYMNVVLSAVKEVRPDGRVMECNSIDIVARSIRYVHIPPEINCTQQLVLYSNGLDRLQRGSMPHTIKDHNKRPRSEMEEDQTYIYIDN